MTVLPPDGDRSEAERQENQLRFLVTVGGRYWRLIALLTVGTACLLVGLGYLSSVGRAPVGFEATVEVGVRPVAWEKAGAAGERGPGVVEIGPAEALKRFSKRGVAEAVAEARGGTGLLELTELSEGEGAAEWDAGDIEEALGIAPAPNGASIVVSVRAANERDAAALVELATGAVIEENDARLKQEFENAASFLKDELASLRENLDVAERAQWEFLKDKGFHTYEEVTEQLRKKSDELVETQAKRNEVLASLSEIEGELRKNHETLPVALSQITDSLIAKMLDELEGLRKEELAMDVVYTAEYGPLRDLRAEISEKERAILEAVRRFEEGSGSGANVWDDCQRLRGEHARRQLELATLDGRMANLREGIEGLFTRLPEFAKNGYEYSAIFRKVEGFRSQYSKMLEREFDLQAAMRAGAGQLTVVTPAATVALPSPRARHGINALIGALVGLLVSFSLAIMLDMMDTSIKDQEDVARFLGLPVIATIPKMRWPKGRRRRRPERAAAAPGRVAPCIVTVNDPKSPISEAYRILRTNFQFATAQWRPKTVMVTSAVPGEGKTTTAINMAVALAASGARVLLVDADLRRPNVHRMLRVNRSPGLTEVLSEGMDIHDVMQATLVENLLVVPSGRVPANPSELVNSERMRRLMTQLGQEFDVVICDAPSVIVVTDAILLASQVDSVVMLVSVNNARRETIQRALRLLDTAQAQVAGVVLNGLEPGRRRYYYYYYYDDERKGKQRRRWYHE